jgi:trehalose synthase
MQGTLARTRKALDEYQPIVGDQVIDGIERLAAPLQGLRVLHLSVTAFGTGVADLLNAAVPLLSDAGIACQWQVVRPTEEWAAANKALYRALAGLERDFSNDVRDAWLRSCSMNADLLTEPYDVVVVHDPQPSALYSFLPEATRARTKWVLHSHLDLSSASDAAWQVVRPYLDGYDAIVFDDSAFVHASLGATPVTIIKPAIDPLGPRNMELSDEASRTILERYGIDYNRPLLSQLSPCDPASDMLGVMDIHTRLRERFPDLQLALIATSPPEDDEAAIYLDQVARSAKERPDVRILRGQSEVGNVEVNALQRASDVVVQKGLRRGYGIWIADALWKQRPVVAAQSGALPRQVLNGKTGILASTADEFDAAIESVLSDTVMARELGRAAQQHVKDHYLITRFIEDELRLLTDLVDRAA